MSVLHQTAAIAVISASLVATMIGVSMAVCVLGHLVRARIVLVVGLIMVFASTGLMLIGGYGAWSSSEGQAPDPLRGGPGGVATVPEKETVNERRQRIYDEKLKNSQK